MPLRQRERRPLALQVGGKDVTLEMIDCDERNAEAVGQALRAGDADEERADESRTGTPFQESWYLLVAFT